MCSMGILFLSHMHPCHDGDQGAQLANASEWGCTLVRAGTAYYNVRCSVASKTLFSGVVRELAAPNVVQIFRP